MDRIAFNTCMKPWMTGGGPERKERFCIGAKICSGKSSNEIEAKKLCDEAALNPKPPKQRRTKGNCKIDANVLAACIVKALDGSEITLANLVPTIAGCTGGKAGQKVEPISTQKVFLKQCYKENPIRGVFGSRSGYKEAQKIRLQCTAKWKEQEVSS